MSTATAEPIDTSAGPGPVEEPVKTTAVPTPAAAATTQDDDDDDAWGTTNRKFKWRSGHCGGTTCRDGQFDGPDGEKTRRCLHVGINGVRASSPYSICACECHEGQELPDMTSIVAEWQAAQKG